jgi:AraC family transcriptional regulator
VCCQPRYNTDVPRLDARTLFTSPVVTVTDTRCREASRPSGPERIADPRAQHLVLTRTGMFVQHPAGGAPLIVDPGTVLFFNRGDAYRTTNPASGVHECTILTFAVDVATDVVAASDPAALDRPDAPFSHIYGRVPLRFAFRYHALRAALRAGCAPAEAVEEEALGILHAAVVASDGDRARTAGRDGARRHRELAAAVRERLARAPGEKHPLAEMAHTFGCSPFHLARVFRREERMPIHRYLLQLRLALALERIGDGQRDLAALAFELGFSSHSHFTEQFRQSYGFAPSVAKEALVRRAVARTIRS